MSVLAFSFTFALMSVLLLFLAFTLAFAFVKVVCHFVISVCFIYLFAFYF